MITIYTDGASRGNPGPGGWAAIVIAAQQIIELGGREDHTTNNRMELAGTIKGLEYTGKLFDEPVELHTDSEYVMKGITLWVSGWQKRKWKTASKKPVLNQDLWRALLKVSVGRQIEWKYVAGHSGHKLNDRCDEIATSFADDLSTPLYHGSRDSYKHL